MGGGSPVRFAEVRRLLARNGWQLTRIAGSHRIFKKPGDRDFSVPVHGGQVKAKYAPEIEKYTGDKV